MLTRKLTRPTARLALGFLAGLLAQSASATEELVVNGADIQAFLKEGEARLKSDMAEYVRALNHDLKATLDEELKQIEMPKLRIALRESANRG